jgi:hypothetical protein
LLLAFDALSPAEQHDVVCELLRRTTVSDDLPEAALHELADELFRSYDAEETALADRALSITALR